jgi:hypothetical protein
MTFLDGYLFGWGVIMAGTTAIVVLTLGVNLLHAIISRGRSDDQ